MKSNKKPKGTFVLTSQKPSSKLLTPRPENVAPPSELRKLLQYRDYLLSLRKMDLGSLIHKNTNRRKQQTQNFSVAQEHMQKSLTATKQKKSHQQIQNNFFTNPQNIDPKKIKQISLFSSKKRGLSSQNEATKNKIQQKNKNSVNRIAEHSIQEDDLFCNQNIEEMMKSNQPHTMKLIHLPGNLPPDRDFSTHRSSRCRDFSMPSIEERNLSEESEDSLETNTKNRDYRGSVSGGINHRKYNSCDHSNSVYEEKQSQMKQKPKRNSFVVIPFTSRNRTKQQKDQSWEKQNLQSTRDINSSSGQRSAKIKEKYSFDVSINPFNFKSELNQQKERQKLSLNVSQIVKRINSRQSKSSMSDRSYRKKHPNTQQGSQIQNNKKSNDKVFGETINEKIYPINFDQSRILTSRKTINLQETNHKKSFKTQVRQFREKHYLIMKLGEE